MAGPCGKEYRSSVNPTTAPHPNENRRTCAHAPRGITPDFETRISSQLAIDRMSGKLNESSFPTNAEEALCYALWQEC